MRPTYRRKPKAHVYTYHTHIQTHTHTHRQTHKHTDTHTHTQTHANKKDTQSRKGILPQAPLKYSWPLVVQASWEPKEGLSRPRSGHGFRAEERVSRSAEMGCRHANANFVSSQISGPILSKTTRPSQPHIWEPQPNARGCNPGPKLSAFGENRGVLKVEPLGGFRKLKLGPPVERLE